jgi:hypothetical protein
MTNHGTAPSITAGQSFSQATKKLREKLAALAHHKPQQSAPAVQPCSAFPPPRWTPPSRLASVPHVFVSRPDVVNRHLEVAA